MADEPIAHGPGVEKDHALLRSEGVSELNCGDVPARAEVVRRGWRAGVAQGDLAIREVLPEIDDRGRGVVIARRDVVVCEMAVLGFFVPVANGGDEVEDLMGAKPVPPGLHRGSRASDPDGAGDERVRCERDVTSDVDHDLSGLLHLSGEAIDQERLVVLGLVDEGVRVLEGANLPVDVEDPDEEGDPDQSDPRGPPPAPPSADPDGDDPDDPDDVDPASTPDPADRRADEVAEE